ncbi:O-antigen ligase-like membrane protein [Tenacibaculum adriaticum]|uniref:O-antigen ligase-like membrane protein n=1 Tax=Tenacibaculum adriaticum TaxID=413713 RepID=A0A5S5DXB0_9FLAO|nr:O-antigen ligase family protein [Tenacibaculum adriaticum]TYP99898.1 O-antigen ligase-like membrane protein [Tenacibaculum adriaticum]
MKLINKIQFNTQNRATNYSSILLYLLVMLSIGKLATYTTIGIVLFAFYLFFLILRKKTTIDKFFHTFFYLLVFSSIYVGDVFKVITIILLLLFLAIYKKTKSTERDKNFNYFEYLFLLLFTLITINSIIFPPRFKGLDVFIYFFIIPFLFIGTKYYGFTISLLKTIRVFITSCLIASVSLFLVNFYNGTLFLKTNPQFSEPIGLTHVYFGLYLTICNILFLTNNLKNTPVFNPIKDFFIIIFNTFLLLYVGARMSLIAFIIVLLFFGYKKVTLKPYHKILSLGLVIIGVIFIGYKTPRFNQGLDEFSNLYTIIKTNNKKELIKESWKNIPLRYLTYKYTFEELKSKWPLGVGMQNVRPHISNKIINDGYKYYHPINSHNQYVHFFIGMGSIGLVFFLFLIIQLGKNSNINPYIFIFFLIVMITESILVRGKGILLFTFFNLLYVNKNYWND